MALLTVRFHKPITLHKKSKLQFALTTRSAAALTKPISSSVVRNEEEQLGPKTQPEKSFRRFFLGPPKRNFLERSKNDADQAIQTNDISKIDDGLLTNAKSTPGCDRSEQHVEREAGCKINKKWEGVSRGHGMGTPHTCEKRF